MLEMTIPGRVRDTGYGSDAEARYHPDVEMELEERASESADSVLTIAATASLFHSMSDPTRVMILRQLQQGEHRAVDLTDQLRLSQSTVSKHLACLKGTDMVTVRAQGRASVYALKHRAATVALLAAAEAMLDLTGDAVLQCPVHGAKALRTRFGEDGV